MTETWRSIPNYEGLYNVSNLGSVKSLKRQVNGRWGKMNLSEVTLKIHTDRRGYNYVVLFKNGERKHSLIHRLVSLAFIPNPDNKETVNHKSGIKHDNRIENLEWCTNTENMRHAYATGIRSNDHLNKKVQQLDLSGNLIKVWDSILEAARSLNISKTGICACCSGKMYGVNKERRLTAGKFKWIHQKAAAEPEELLASGLQ